MPDQVEALCSGTVNGQPVTYAVMLDLQVVALPGSQFGSVDDVAIEHASLAAGQRVPQGGPYKITYQYRGKKYEQTDLWGDENGQLVAVKP